MNKKIKLLLSVGVLLLFSSFKLFAVSLGGAPNYFAYKTQHNVFYDQQSAVGYVRMDNGFTVTVSKTTGRTHGSSVLLDTCISVSGYIDLRDTNTMILLSDLHLDSGTSFSSSGRIYGRNTALILHGNLNLPNNIILHFGGNMAIEGNGNTLSLGENSQLFIDQDATLTLRNLIINNSKNFVGNPAIKLASSGSLLALDNSVLDITGDFCFDRGSFFIHNDVIFTGTSSFVYSSCQPSFITSGANLFFDVGTTFSFAPSTYTVCPYSVSRTYTTSDFIKMIDNTSKIIFNGCDFYTTLTGLRVTTGEIDFDNKINLRSKATNDVNSTTPVVAIGSPASTGSQSQSATWSPDGRFLAVVNPGASNTLQIFRFTTNAGPILVGTASTNDFPVSVQWSPDGMFLAVANVNSNTLQIFRFTGSGNPVVIAFASTGSGAQSSNWSPDGKFIAVLNNNVAAFQIFRFTGSGRPTLVGFASTGVNPYWANWSPDGKFIAVLCWDATLQIFRFTGSGNPIAVAPAVSTGIDQFAVNWSPDGRFLAFANLGSNTIQIFRFTGSGKPILVGFAATGSSPVSAKWSPDGRFLAVGCAGDATLQIFKFTGNGNPVAIGTPVVVTESSISSVDWSGDGRFLAILDDGIQKLYTFSVNYINNTQTQNLSNSIVFGNSGLGSSYDLNVRLLAGARVSVDGLINYDNVN